jgi:hypothetical protein
MKIISILMNNNEGAQIKTVKWTFCLIMVCAMVVAIQTPVLAADTDALVVDEHGNVGIGTISPEAKLHIIRIVTI